MPIKWSALKVAEAMDKVEVRAARIIVPLQEARAVIEETLKLPNLPEYMGQTLRGMIGDIDSSIGYTATWDKQFHPGNLIAGIRRIRDSLPKNAIDTEKERLRTGTTGTMFGS